MSEKMGEKFYPDEMERAYDPTNDELIKAQQEARTRMDHLVLLQKSQAKVQKILDGTTDEGKKDLIRAELKELDTQILRARDEFERAREKRRETQDKLDNEDIMLALHEKERLGHDD